MTGTLTANTPTMSGSNLQILLVDDHGESLVVLAKLLNRSGYKVRTACSYAEAMDVAGREPIDLLISDVGLPDRSGLELMQELRTARPTKGIALSGFTDERDIQASYEAGFAKHLNKPLVFTDLLAAIAEVTGWGHDRETSNGTYHAVN